jgi:hypothetical protein
LVALAALSYSTTWGWDDERTHKDLTDFAAHNSVLGLKEDYMESIGFTDGLDQILPGNIQQPPQPSTVCDDGKNQTQCTVVDWLKYGAEKEDDATFLPLPNIGYNLRYNNHFHDPLREPGEEGKWNAMKTRLAAGDIDGALQDFEPAVRPQYEYNFNALQDHLGAVLAGMQQVTLVKATADRVDYELVGVQNGQCFSFLLVFKKGADGIWHIRFF